MGRNLPPFILLQTIEAVTRLGSLKRAAAELHVTPSAISHRVRLVEEAFGRRLFEREGQGIRATDAARGLATAVASALQQVEECWAGLVESHAGRPTRLCAMSVFAEHFILAESARFRRKFPDFQLDSTSLSVAEGGMRGDYDILVGVGPYPDESWVYEDLLPLMLKPVCAAGAAARFVDGRVVRGPLLVTRTESLAWEMAAGPLGLEIAAHAEIVRFDSLLATVHAAIDGRGVALAPAWIAERLVQEGRAQSFGHGAFDSGIVYWTAARKSRRLDSTYGRFRRWLQAMVADAAAGGATGGAAAARPAEG